MSNFVEDLEWRGLIQDISDRDGLLKLPKGTPFYVGFDPTAPSLQLGNLVPVIVSLRLAKAGFKAIQLFGGATGAIGDPSGKSNERKLLSREDIENNVANHKRTVTAIFERAGVTTEVVDNYEWTRDLTVIPFLRDIGKHFTVNYMLAKEVVKTRLDGEGISFTEFSYMLLQSNDFLHLLQTKGCRLQIGGSDQWGNITAGLELIRRKGQGEAYAFSIPLITDSQGRKFGKSESGAIWLDAAFTSPYKFHQFWLNIEDADVEKYLRIFTFLSTDKISELEKMTAAAPEKRAAQKALADEVCTLVHGEKATELAKKSAEVLFGGSIEGIPDSELEEIFSDVPSSHMSRGELAAMTVLDALVKTGLVSSKGEGRRLITSGGAYLNNQRISEPEKQFSGAWFETLHMLILRAGKKNYHLIKIG